MKKNSLNLSRQMSVLAEKKAWADQSAKETLIALVGAFETLPANISIGLTTWGMSIGYHLNKSAILHACEQYAAIRVMLIDLSQRMIAEGGLLAALNQDIAQKFKDMEGLSRAYEADIKFGECSVEIDEALTKIDEVLALYAMIKKSWLDLVAPVTLLCRYGLLSLDDEQRQVLLGDDMQRVTSLPELSSLKQEVVHQPIASIDAHDLRAKIAADTTAALEAEKQRIQDEADELAQAQARQLALEAEQAEQRQQRLAERERAATEQLVLKIRAAKQYQAEKKLAAMNRGRPENSVGEGEREKPASVVDNMVGGAELKSNHELRSEEKATASASDQPDDGLPQEQSIAVEKKPHLNSEALRQQSIDALVLSFNNLSQVFSQQPKKNQETALELVQVMFRLRSLQSIEPYVTYFSKNPVHLVLLMNAQFVGEPIVDLIDLLKQIYSNDQIVSQISAETLHSLLKCDQQEVASATLRFLNFDTKASKQALFTLLDGAGIDTLRELKSCYVNFIRQATNDLSQFTTNRLLTLLTILSRHEKVLLLKQQTLLERLDQEVKPLDSDTLLALLDISPDKLVALQGLKQISRQLSATIVNCAKSNELFVQHAPKIIVLLKNSDLRRLLISNEVIEKRLLELSVMADKELFDVLYPQLLPNSYAYHDVKNQFALIVERNPDFLGFTVAHPGLLDKALPLLSNLSEQECVAALRDQQLGPILVGNQNRLPMLGQLTKAQWLALLVKTPSVLVKVFNTPNFMDAVCHFKLEDKMELMVTLNFEAQARLAESATTAVEFILGELWPMLPEYAKSTLLQGGFQHLLPVPEHLIINPEQKEADRKFATIIIEALRHDGSASDVKESGVLSYLYKAVASRTSRVDAVSQYEQALLVDCSVEAQNRLFSYQGLSGQPAIRLRLLHMSLDLMKNPSKKKFQSKKKGESWLDKSITYLIQLIANDAELLTDQCLCVEKFSNLDVVILKMLSKLPVYADSLVSLYHVVKLMPAIDHTYPALLKQIKSQLQRYYYLQISNTKDGSLKNHLICQQLSLITTAENFKTALASHSDPLVIFRQRDFSWSLVDHAFLDVVNSLREMPFFLELQKILLIYPMHYNRLPVYFLQLCAKAVVGVEDAEQVYAYLMSSNLYSLGILQRLAAEEDLDGSLMMNPAEALKMLEIYEQSGSSSSELIADQDNEDQLQDHFPVAVSPLELESCSEVSPPPPPTAPDYSTPKPMVSALNGEAKPDQSPVSPPRNPEKTAIHPIAAGPSNSPPPPPPPPVFMGGAMATGVVQDDKQVAESPQATDSTGLMAQIQAQAVSRKKMGLVKPRKSAPAPQPVNQAAMSMADQIKQKAELKKVEREKAEAAGRTIETQLAEQRKQQFNEADSSSDSFVAALAKAMANRRGAIALKEEDEDSWSSSEEETEKVAPVASSKQLKSKAKRIPSEVNHGPPPPVPSFPQQSDQSLGRLTAKARGQWQGRAAQPPAISSGVDLTKLQAICQENAGLSGKWSKISVAVDQLLLRAKEEDIEVRAELDTMLRELKINAVLVRKEKPLIIEWLEVTVAELASAKSQDKLLI